MASSKTSTWVGGAVAVALVLILASYFLLISPVLASASDTSSQADETRQQNQILQTKVAHLAAQFAHLDDYKAQLADLRTEVPTEAQLSAYLRRIDAIADANKVTVTAVAADVPQHFSPAVPPSTGSGDATVDQTTAQQSGATATPSASPTKAAAQAAAPSVSAPDGMVDVPLTITVVGSYDHVDKFLNAIQTTKGRLLLITTVTGTGQKDADANAGRPATKVGDLEVTANGFLYVLPDTSSPAPAPTATATPSLPAVVPGKNPMVPASS